MEERFVAISQTEEELIKQSKREAPESLNIQAWRWEWKE